MSQALPATCYMSSRFRDHDPGPWHPERPERYDAVAAAAVAAGAVQAEAPAAPLTAIERVHSAAYVDAVERFCRGGGGALDPDTIMHEASWEAALRAAGGAMAAVDHVARHPGSAAFSLGRPPGHHAETARAMGFCIINSAAVAAAHALAELGCARVAVVDWDAHHGNGTQAIFYDDPSVLYVSLHQYPFYPGTGAAGERGVGDGVGATVNVPLGAGTGRDEYLDAFRTVALPAVTSFEPEVLIVSAGFDAHRDDPLCALGLDADGFAEMATALREICGGPALVLEGGYSLPALESSVASVLGAVSR
jgi:acetoin utilization deacetylase AcuC-like enzyme